MKNFICTMRILLVLLISLSFSCKEEAKVTRCIDNCIEDISRGVFDRFSSDIDKRLYNELKKVCTDFSKKHKCLNNQLKHVGGGTSFSVDYLE
jgi:hypothetical protein